MLLTWNNQPSRLCGNNISNLLLDMSLIFEQSINSCWGSKIKMREINEGANSSKIEKK